MIALGPAGGGLAGCAEKAPIVGALCTPEHRCPSPYTCVGGRCAESTGRPTRCQYDEDCAFGVCLVSSGFCVQCTSDTHCAIGACLAAHYQCGCDQHSQCSTRRCHRATSTCLPCLDDAQCESGDCDVDSGICRKKVNDNAATPEGNDAGGRF